MAKLFILALLLLVSIYSSAGERLILKDSYILIHSAEEQKTKVMEWRREQNRKIDENIKKSNKLTDHFTMDLVYDWFVDSPLGQTYPDFATMGEGGRGDAITTLDSITLTGDSDWIILSNDCMPGMQFTGVNVACEMRVTFSPQRTGIQYGKVVVKSHSVSVVGGDDAYQWSNTTTYYLVGSSYKRPSGFPCDYLGSVVRPSNQSLGEVIPLVGMPFDLAYSSAFASEYKSDIHELVPDASFNFEGWTPTIYHYYDWTQHRLYLGSGVTKEAKAYEVDSTGLLYAVAQSDNNEVYYFNRNGRHLETRTALTGALKYSFQYDSNGRLIGITDSFGNETTIGRNTIGKISGLTSARGQVTTVNIGVNGFIAAVTNPMGETYSATYKNGTSLLETFTKPGSQVSTFHYDIDGKLTKDLGHGGNFWELIRSPGAVSISSNMGRATSYSSILESTGAYSGVQISPSGAVTNVYESRSTDIVTSHGITNQVERQYDSRFGLTSYRTAGFKTKINSVEKSTTLNEQVTYPTGVTPGDFNFSQLKRTETTNGRISDLVFDNIMKKFVKTSPLGATTETLVNFYERPIAFKVGNDTPTHISYNSDGTWASSVQGASHNQNTYTYNSSGWLQSVTNALSEVTTYAYDLAGRVTSVTLPDLRVIQYGYDLNGNITSVTPPSRPVHNFTFNAMELMSEYQPPTLSGVLNVNTQYAYNMDKQLTQITRPNGDVANFNYNATTGLLSSLSWSGGTRTFSYHPNTDLVSRVDMSDGNRSNYTYYGRNIATEEQRWISGDWLFGKVINTYDNEHRFSGRTVQGNSATNYSSYTINYNNDDKPSRIGFVYYNYEYPSGRLSSTTMDTVSDSYTYDTYGNLSGYSATYTPSGSGTPQLLYSYTLTRDAINRITGKSETIQGVSSTYSYSYDNVGRLTGVIKDGLPYSSYTYDSNSNRISGMTGGVTFTATYDNQDRLITYGSKNYTYNSNGDLSHIVYSDATSHEFWFDAFGNIQYIKRRDGSWETYYADGKNRLMAGYLGTSLMHRRIYQDDYRIAARLNDSGVMSENYVYGSHISTPEYISKGGYRQRVIRDHLGSPRLVVRTLDGVVSQRMDYNEFGEVINDTNPGYQPYGFAGGIYFPSTKMVKFGARFYDASVGRWLSKDPILFNGDDTNLYGYVANDPVNLVDPSGLISQEARQRAARYAATATVVGVGVGVACSAGLGSLGIGAAFGVAGYVYGAGPELKSDFIDFVNGNPAADNIFQEISNR